ncbi:MAG: hypothetical protein L3J82_05510 [Planctomycetes bacterium]|nr:hypothetical protein [Planctomycetota bacterium]
MSKAKTEVKSSDFQQTLRERLLILTDRHQQAEIAARTGTPAANVHRYLKAGKIPSEFLGSIVEHFDVDPEWLLTGKGEQTSSTVRAETAAKAGELLDLVQAMNAISRMRLGAIVKDKDRKLMRELGDALQTYDSLREKMNQQSRPVMKQLIEELRGCLSEMNLDRARVTAQTALELSRICLDDKLLLELDTQIASLSYITGQLEEAVLHDRKIFARRMINGIIQTPEQIASCTNFVMVLRDTGRSMESLRVGKAILALIPDHDQPLPALLILQMMIGMLEVETGDVESGLARCYKIWPKTDVRSRVSETVMILRANTLSGMMNYYEAVEYGDNSPGKARLLTRFAGAMEDGKALKHAITKLIGDAPVYLPIIEFDARRTQLLESIINDKQGSLEDFDRLVEGSPPVVASRLLGDLTLAIYRAQVARLTGNKKKLQAMVTETSRCLGKLSPDISITVEFRIIHLRNMKALAGKSHVKELKALQAELDTAVGRGFRGIANLV